MTIRAARPGRVPSLASDSRPAPARSLLHRPRSPPYAIGDMVTTFAAGGPGGVVEHPSGEPGLRRGRSWQKSCLSSILRVTGKRPGA